MTIGLLTIVMIASAFASNVVIRSLHSAHKIEAADRAYFAAEAGLEDSLYELSARFAGYETPDLDGADVRTHVFSASPDWRGRWEIKNKMESDSDFSGGLYAEQKLIVNLFQDTSGGEVLDENVINDTAITPANIGIIDVTSGVFNVAFSVPWDTGTGYSLPAFASGFTVDNDEDGFLNEDGPNDYDDEDDSLTCGSVDVPSQDADCDGREDEDSPEDIVIKWQIIDDEGRSLVPTDGCLNGVGAPEDPDPQGSQICEKDFVDDGSYLTAIFNDSSKPPIARSGVNQLGDEVLINTFIAPGYDDGSGSGPRPANSKLQIEFFITSPLKQSYDDSNDGVDQVIDIPYLSYKVTVPGGTRLPKPLFTIKADGFYDDFKQSIISYLTPKTTTPLLGGVVTIIQQE